MRRGLAALLLVVTGIVGCTFPPLETPTPAATPSPTPLSTTPPATPTPTASPSSDPTPDLADVPSFAGGEIVATTTDGLRVRQRPGLSSAVVTGLLPLATEVQVLMGPIPLDGLGWYLVANADPDGPEFSEGWIAAGFEPEPFLRSTGRTAEDGSVVASYALTGDAEYGPVDISDEDHAIRWAAVAPGTDRCSFTVLLEPADGEPLRAIRATIGDDLVPGTLQPTFFMAQPDLRGQVFVIVESTCAWSLFVTRLPDPGADPTPTAEDDP